ncbi:MAG: hypothetical protein ACREM6_15580 [Vulcanimicrobiaceae bacterium]
MTFAVSPTPSPEEAAAIIAALAALRAPAVQPPAPMPAWRRAGRDYE